MGKAIVWRPPVSETLVGDSERDAQEPAAVGAASLDGFRRAAVGQNRTRSGDIKSSLSGRKGRIRTVRILTNGDTQS